MSEWDKLCKEMEEQLGVYQLSPEWVKVKAEGDLLLREKRSLLIYAKMLRDENARLEKHNVFLLNEIDKVLSDE